MGTPSLNGGNGRGADGRFQAGNKLGRGNPHARKVNQLRSAYVDGVSREDMEDIRKAVVAKAKSGDLVAVRELCDRLWGRCASHDLTARVEALEQSLNTNAEN